MRRLLLTLASTAALAGCVGAPQRPVPQPAPPVPVPTPTPRPAAPTLLPPASADWRDWPLTPGTWSWRQDARGSIALFGRPGAQAELTLRCDRTAGRITLARLGEGAGALTLRTSSTLRRLDGAAVSGLPYRVVSLAASDSLIDAMGFSRGRFIVESPDLPTLVIPAWAEILRVAEDCRG
jgi:hypothetical protein